MVLFRVRKCSLRALKISSLHDPGTLLHNDSHRETQENPPQEEGVKPSVLFRMQPVLLVRDPGEAEIQEEMSGLEPRGRSPAQLLLHRLHVFEGLVAEVGIVQLCIMPSRAH